LRADTAPELFGSRRRRFTAGVQNVLDSEPHFAAGGGPWRFDESQSDLPQRFVYLRLSYQLH